jgi:hypothetical protein
MSFQVDSAHTRAGADHDHREERSRIHQHTQGARAEFLLMAIIDRPAHSIIEGITDVRE